MAVFLYRATLLERGESASAVARSGVVHQEPGFVSASQVDLKEFNIGVYYCGNDSGYDLSGKVAELNSLVTDFYLRESGGTSNITFEFGANGSKITSLHLPTTTLGHWFLRVNDRSISWDDPCRTEAKRRAGHSNVLVLVDMPTGPGPDGSISPVTRR